MPFRARVLPRSLTRRHAAPTLSRGPRQNATTPNASRHIPPTLSSPSHIRRFTTTATSSSGVSDFFSFRRGRGESSKATAALTPENAKQEFLASIERGDREGLISSYNLLVSSRLGDDTATFPSPALSPKDLSDGMNLLANAPDIYAYSKVLDQIYRDIRHIWNYDLDIGHRSAFALGLCRAGKGGRALRVLRGEQQDRVDWSALLALTMEYDPMASQAVWETLRVSQSLSSGDCALRLVNLRNMAVLEPIYAVKELDALLKEIQRLQVEMDETMEADVVRIRNICGQYQQADDLVEGWTRRNPDRKAWKEDMRIAEIGLLVHTDLERATRLCVEMNDQGNRVPGWVPAEIAWNRFNHFRLPILDAIESAERDTLTPMESEGWTRFFLKLRNRSGFRSSEVTEMYRIARSRGTGITAGLADIIIELYAQERKDVPVDRALEVYEDAIRSDIDLDHPANRNTLRSATGRLLTISALPSQVRPDIAVRLLEEADARGFDIPEDDQTLYKLNRLIKYSPNHSVGYKIFTLYRRQNVVAQKTFNAMLNAFINLSPPSQPNAFLLPPVDLLMRLVKDGMSTGLAMDKHPITSLISRYGWLATQNFSDEDRQVRSAKLLKAVKDLHLQIKMDPNLAPDPTLLCALMDAYNRMDNYSEAMNIWGDLVARRKYLSADIVADTYPTAVIIALDFTSFAGQEKHARQVWNWAKKHGFANSTKVWNTRVESLCRLYLFQEATDLVCVEMKEQLDQAPKPDQETIRTLLKFSWRVPDLRPAILQRLEKEFPDLWDAVKIHVNQVHRPGYEERRAFEKGEKDGNELGWKYSNRPNPEAKGKVQVRKTPSGKYIHIVK